MSKKEAQTKQFLKAIDRLKEVLSMPKSVLVRDASIKRFEMAFDLTWKLLKTIMEEEDGIVCQSPKNCLREAYKQGWLEEYNDEWMQMALMRNYTVHCYSEDLAEQLFKILPSFLNLLEGLKVKIIF